MKKSIHALRRLWVFTFMLVGVVASPAISQEKIFSMPTGDYSGSAEGQERRERRHGVDLSLASGGVGTLMMYHGYFKDVCYGRYIVQTAEVTGDILTITAGGGLPGCPGPVVLKIMDDGKKLNGTIDNRAVWLNRK